MTIKGPRTGALAKMTREEKDRFSMGGWVDESIPEDAVLRAISGIGGNVDPDGFIAFLGPGVGRYRSHIESAAPSVAEELKWAKTTMEFTEEMRERIQNFPPHIEAEAGLAHWKRHKEMLHTAIQRLNAELKEIWVTLALAERAVAPHGGKAGRKTAWARDSLLSEIAEWFGNAGVGPDESARFSRNTLVALDIPAPDKPAEAIRKHTKRLSRMRE